MCVILAKAPDGAGDGLHVHQVIESLAYSQGKKAVTVFVDVMVANATDRERCLLVVHPGFVHATTEDFSLVSRAPQAAQQDTLPPDLVLRMLFREQIGRPGASPTFHERTRGFFLAERGPTKIDHVDRVGVQVLMPSSDERAALERTLPAFTCVQVQGLEPGISWFRIRMNMSGLSYDSFVGDQQRFWVNGPTRVYEELLEDIERKDKTTPSSAHFFRTALTAPQILPPDSLDVVVFGVGTTGVDTHVVCEPVSGDVYDATDESNSHLARRFVTHSPSFWIDLYYEGSLAIPSDDMQSQIVKLTEDGIAAWNR